MKEHASYMSFMYGKVPKPFIREPAGSMEKGMHTLELSFQLLEIPNDEYTLLSQFLIGCSKVPGADWLIMDNQGMTILPCFPQNGVDS